MREQNKNPSKIKLWDNTHSLSLHPHPDMNQPPPPPPPPPPPHLSHPPYLNTDLSILFSIFHSAKNPLCYNFGFYYYKIVVINVHCHYYNHYIVLKYFCNFIMLIQTIHYFYHLVFLTYFQLLFMLIILGAWLTVWH